MVTMQQRNPSGYGVHSSPEQRFAARKRRLKRLDTRRRRLLTGISRGMTISEAGKHAGYMHRQAAHRAFSSIQLWIPQALEGAGYPVDKLLTELVEKLHDPMEAKKIRFFKYRDVVTEIREVEAHNVQLTGTHSVIG